MTLSRTAALAILAFTISPSPFAWASDTDAPDPTTTATETPKQTTESKNTDPEQPSASADTEEPHTTHHFLGLRGRLVVIPQFMFAVFSADGGHSVVAPSIGPEYAARRDDFEYDVALTYSSYGMDDAPFKASSDPDNAYEIVSSEIKTLTISVDFLWSHPLTANQKLAFVYGGGAGLGAVFGDLHRNQSTPRSGAPGDPEDYVPCAGPAPNNTGYCGNDNDHYGDYTEPNWFNGGSKPIIMPWIALPQVGLRWAPDPKFAARLDMGLSFPGPFFVGIAGQYRLL